MNVSSAASNIRKWLIFGALVEPLHGDEGQAENREFWSVFHAMPLDP